MAVEDPTTTPVEPDPAAKPVEEPRTMTITTCVICAHNAVNGVCPHCGHQAAR